uniref:IF rod domain-containing protein n=1 Tax=Leptobrachium leishanense TaxID=445787 RepID=A0A8C5QKM7_9ANUR
MGIEWKERPLSWTFLPLSNDACLTLTSFCQFWPRFGSVRGGQGNNPKSSGSYGVWRNHGLLTTDGKETMKILNERLASYLEKVHSLEKKNAEFERKICDWYTNNAPSSLPDTTQYMRTIQGLESQVKEAPSTENSRILLQIDNASLAAEDLRIKYEIEAYLRTKTEADVGTLCQGIGDLGRELQNLDVQVKCLDEELLQLNTNHEEEVNMLQSQLGARVNVEMNTAPSVDLNKALSQVRDEYEKLMERNLNEIEAMFLQRTAELGQQVTSGAEQLQSVNNELIDLKRSAQTLDIELQNETRMKCAMEESLLENEASYGSQLSQLQALIDKVEAQLSQILTDLKHLNFKYQLLMDQKTHLEKEIATYKHLLEAQDVQYVYYLCNSRHSVCTHITFIRLYIVINCYFQCSIS